MSTKVEIVVMNADEHEHQKHIDRAAKVLEGVFGHPLVFVLPTVTEGALTTASEEASTAQGLVKGGGVQATITRNTKSLILFLLLSKIILYVNGLFKGIPDKLGLSGFDLSSQPVPRPIPEPPVVDRTEKGRVAHSVKVFLVKKVGKQKKDSFTYNVQVAEVAVLPLVYKDVLQTKSMFKIVLINCVKGIELSIRISKSNSRGTSDWSSPVTHIPQ